MKSANFIIRNQLGIDYTGVEYCWFGMGFEWLITTWYTQRTLFAVQNLTIFFCFLLKLGRVHLQNFPGSPKSKSAIYAVGILFINWSSSSLGRENVVAYVIWILVAPSPRWLSAPTDCKKLWIPPSRLVWVSVCKITNWILSLSRVIQLAIYPDLIRPRWVAQCWKDKSDADMNEKSSAVDRFLSAHFKSLIPRGH